VGALTRKRHGIFRRLGTKKLCRGAKKNENFTLQSINHVASSNRRVGAENEKNTKGRRGKKPPWVK